MHLLMIAPEQNPFPPASGSVEICMYAIARKLAVKHKVTLISRRSAQYPKTTQHGNLTIVRVPKGSPKKYIAAVISRIRGKRYDWIQIDNRPRFLAPIKQAFPNTPVSLFLHSLIFVSKPMISQDAALNYLTKADKIVVNSNSLQRVLTKRFPSVSHVIKHVYLGVDLQRFRPATLRQRQQLRKKYGVEGTFVFVFAGRIIPRKGLSILMRALAHVRNAIPKVKLVVAGNGKKRYLFRLKRLAHRLRITVKFIGYKPHQAMHQTYWLADCFVCPSQKHEAFGLVNVEAMAAGLPVIASQIGGIKEVVQHGKNGLLVENYKNPKAFGKAMLKLARDHTLTEALGKQARMDMAHRFSWNNTANSLMGLYVK